MVLTDKLKRSVTLTVAALLFLASLVPLLTRQQASAAYSILGPRQIRMSTSAGGASGVTYRVRFEIPNTTPIGGIVVAFCQGSPIIEDTDCLLPVGFNTATSTVSGQSAAGTDAETSVVQTDITSLTTVTHLKQDNNLAGAVGTNTLVLSNASTVTPGGANREVFFNIDGVHNPTASNATFYARIYTYGTASDATNYTLANPYAGGPAVNAGGIALSTANQITITSKVQERLTFCVYTFPVVAGTDTPADPLTDNNCSGKSGSSIDLGDQNGVLDSQRAFVDKTSYFSITTNAAGDAVVRLKGNTLSNGTNTITAIGHSATTSAPGTEQFGLCAYHFDTAGSTLGISDGTDPSPNDADYTGAAPGPVDCSNTAQSAKLTTPPALGLDDNGANFAFDTANTNTTYGQVIATKPAGSFSTGRLAFIGNITDTTEPGIYTTTLTFIATGTY